MMDNNKFETDKETTRQEVIQAISTEFNSVYVIYLDKNFMEPYVQNNSISKNFTDLFKSGVGYESIIKSFAEKYVIQEDKFSFLEVASVENIKKTFKTKKCFNYVFRRKNDENDIEFVEEYFYKLDDNMLGERAVFCIRNVSNDKEIIQNLKYQIERQMQLERNLSMYKAALSKIYPFAALVNVTENRYYIIEDKHYIVRTSKVEGVFDNFINYTLNNITDETEKK